MKLLVIGGAGYVGSHFIEAANLLGHECLCFDNLSRGHRESLPEGVELVEGDLCDTPLLAKTIRGFAPDYILHYAAYALAGESVQEPLLYYKNNVEGVVSLCQATKDAQWQSGIVFSSTCAVIGNPQTLPMAEEDPKRPESPYGHSKLMAEQVFRDFAAKSGVKVIALRYFNAAGADLSGRIGESHDPETHLIPNVIRAALEGSTMQIFGKDYPTDDGTCVRDYVHVSDLAEAHLAACRRFSEMRPGSFEAFHLGVGKGYSNLEILRAVEKVSGKAVKFEFGARREGDPAKLYADNRRAVEVLGFAPKYSRLDDIVRTAWDWHSGRSR